ncbi:hypothetical protein HOY34_02340 [Xinfangfangia sp. D13-10-4-6]|uniref:hypothetical protein n=1 Tax=Pseudogemmobacter hezensis TaxID=2737662 RepID=UPI0015517B0B|nr:hypothetical protein [Pseudogemmobacter hezensis]NPD14036.1 hypothetical protein [Pseudogemmobacter hezensis]
MQPRLYLRRLFPMKRMAMLFALLLVAPLPLPHHRAHAQVSEPPAVADGAGKDQADQGLSLIEQGANLLLRSLISELEPSISDMDRALRDLAPQLQAIGPQLAEVARMMEDMRNYDMPVMLENGDILIRRNAPLRNAPGTEGSDPDTDEAAPRPGQPAPGKLPPPQNEIEL